MTRRTILVISGATTLLLLSIGFFGTYTLCNNNENCASALHYFFIYFLPFFPLFVLALITYKMREEVYRVWLHFSYWWIPLSMLAILLAPEYNPDWMWPVEKGTVAFFSSALYILISLALIGWKYVLLREQREVTK